MLEKLRRLLGIPSTFKMNMKIVGQDDIAAEVFLNIPMNKKQLDTLYGIFLDMDKDRSGAVKQSELFLYLEMEFNAFERHLFAALDEDFNGLITFVEFVCNIWNLLTLKETHLSMVMFLLKDPTGEKFLRFDEVKEILEEVHKKKIDSDTALLSVFNKFVVDNHDAGFDYTTINNFRVWAHNNPSIVHPIMQVVLGMRRRLGGELFWEQLLALRYEQWEIPDPIWIKQLYRKIYRRIHSERTEALRVKRRNGDVGPNGEDMRDVATRKRSFMIDFFGYNQDAKVEPDNVIEALCADNNVHRDTHAPHHSREGGGSSEYGGGGIDHERHNKHHSSSTSGDARRTSTASAGHAMHTHALNPFDNAIGRVVDGKVQVVSNVDTAAKSKGVGAVEHSHVDNNNIIAAHHGGGSDQNQHQPHHDKHEIDNNSHEHGAAHNGHRRESHITGHHHNHERHHDTHHHGTDSSSSNHSHSHVNHHDHQGKHDDSHIHNHGTEDVHQRHAYHHEEAQAHGHDATRIIHLRQDIEKKKNAHHERQAGNY